ncbi:MAG: hypothetical protein L6437_14590 [Kiritimatiellae bacterium]|nr:hypothetical protein [Kiritimatiellia bacterium]
MVIQGRKLHAEDIGLIRSLLVEHADWCRTRISEELCHRWDWQYPQHAYLCLRKALPSHRYY